MTAEDYTESVTWLFASLEAAVVGVAERHDLETVKSHWNKADVAKQLHVAGVLPEDFSGTLGILNAARKVAIYEGEEPNLQGWSLDGLAVDVEIAVESAERENAP